jgi:hypothetical protein
MTEIQKPANILNLFLLLVAAAILPFAGMFFVDYYKPSSFVEFSIKVSALVFAIWVIVLVNKKVK